MKDISFEFYNTFYLVSQENSVFFEKKKLALKIRKKNRPFVKVDKDQGPCDVRKEALLCTRKENAVNFFCPLR
jgi:hypothetical protein